MILIGGLVPTITDEDEIPEVQSSSESDEEEVVPKKKKKVSKNKAALASDFFFEHSSVAKSDGILDEIKSEAKRGTASTLDEKIASVRQAKKVRGLKAEVIEEDDLKLEANFDDDEEEEEVPDQAAPDKHDTLKSKQKKGKKKGKESFFETAPPHAVAVHNFHEMNLSRPLLKAITARGFSAPTRIQASCIPVALMGRDICACAATGTGKTAAFMLPILERLLYKPKEKPVTRVLVLVPTRELAIQVFEVARALADRTPISIALSAGGLDVKAQETALRLGPDVVIATPGV